MNISPAYEPTRLLIVDDEASLRDLFAVALMDESRDISTCGDGFSALRALRESHFDLVLLDLSLPDTNGIHILREMRRRGDDTPVILCSAHVNEKAFLSALELGVSSFIAKPATLLTIRSTVANVISGEGNQRVTSAVEFADKFRFSEKAKRSVKGYLDQSRRSS